MVRLGWFGHARHRRDDTFVRIVENWHYRDFKRSQERPNLSWIEGAKNDLKKKV